MIKSILLTMVAVIAGYALMVGLITLVQEVWFGGVGWGTTPVGRLAAASLLTMLAAFIGAAVATAIRHGRTFVPAIIMSCMVAMETTALVITEKVSGPLWFDALSAVLLILAILAGSWSMQMLAGSLAGRSWTA